MLRFRFENMCFSAFCRKTAFVLAAMFLGGSLWLRAQTVSDRSDQIQNSRVSNQELNRIEIYEGSLLTPWSCYTTFERLIGDYHFCRSLSENAPVTVTNFPFSSARFRVFDPTGFPEQVVSGLIAEPYQHHTYVYRLIVGEDVHTRELVFYNAIGEELYRQAEKGGDTLDQLKADISKAPTQQMRRALQYREERILYNRARLQCTYLLMPLDDVMEYAINTVLSQTGQTVRRGHAAAMAMSVTAEAMSLSEPAPQDSAPPPPDPTLFVFTDISISNGVANLGIHLPDSVSCRVDVFSATNLTPVSIGAYHIFPWTLMTTTPTNSGTFYVQLSSSCPTVFFRVGNADIDSDGYGVPDDRKILIYGTTPGAWSTTGDGIPDGWAIINGLNPLDPSVASQDPFGDGVSNLLKYLLGGTPHKFSTALSSASLSFRVTSPCQREVQP